MSPSPLELIYGHANVPSLLSGPFSLFHFYSDILPTGEEDSEKVVLDLSRRQLKKVPKQEDAQNVRVLLLDENELQKIDNIDSYLKIEKVSKPSSSHIHFTPDTLSCFRSVTLTYLPFLKFYQVFFLFTVITKQKSIVTHVWHLPVASITRIESVLQWYFVH